MSRVRTTEADRSLDAARVCEERVDAALRGDPERFLQAESLLRERLVASEVAFGGQPLPVTVKPHFVERVHHEAWVRATQRLFSALEVLGQKVFTEPDLFARLGLSDEARALMDIDPGYSRLAVIARPDMIWSGERVSTYEVNTDSPAMMTFTDYLDEALRSIFPTAPLLDAFEFGKDERTDVLLSGLLRCFREWGGVDSHPSIAIVDWSTEKTNAEQRATARRFSEKGHVAVLADPRELRLVGGRLMAHDVPIDIVYRRVLFGDFLRRKDELRDLMRAYRRGSVCMVNPLSSYALGNKMVLALSRNPEMRRALGPTHVRALDDCLLPTSTLADADRSALLDSPADFVLKCAFGHGGRDVLIGAELDPDDWLQALNTPVPEQWVVQRYAEPPCYGIPELREGRLSIEPRYANWNPFVFDGNFAGAMTRVSANLVVSITAKGALLPSIPTSWKR